MYLENNERLIHDGNYQEFFEHTDDDGDTKARGLEPRDYDTHPLGCYASAPALAVDFPLVPDDEWAPRAADLEAQGALLSQVRMRGNDGQPIPARDQNGKGYCWFHSGVSALLILRALAGMMYEDLSAYAGACKIKNFKDQGGWGAEGVDFLTEHGCPTSAFWAQRSMDRSNDNAATWENAKLYRVVEGFVDVQAAQYDRKLSWAQVASLLLCGIPVVADFNWWSHSVCLLDLVNGATQRNNTRDAGKLVSLSVFDAIWMMDDPIMMGFGVRLLNSWGDSWSNQGMGTLAGTKARPDGAVAPRTTSIAA